jgi:hypothetical protein
MFWVRQGYLLRASTVTNHGHAVLGPSQLRESQSRFYMGTKNIYERFVWFDK